VAVGGDVSPQKIRWDNNGGPGLHKAAETNHEAMIGDDEQSLLAPGGFYVAGFDAANGMVQVSKNIIFSSLNIDDHSTVVCNSNFLLNGGNTCDTGLARKPKGGIVEDSMVTTTEGPGTGLQGSMGIASSPRTNAKDSVATTDSSKK
jgi:hypothetical protein